MRSVIGIEPHPWPVGLSAATAGDLAGAEHILVPKSVPQDARSRPGLLPELTAVDALVVEDLIKRYGRTTAVDGLSFAVPQRQRVRIPRPERRGEDDDAAHPVRALARPRRAGAARPAA